MRLRIFTMSENPTPSSREASRKTVGDVVTVFEESSRVCRGKADYNHCRLPIANGGIEDCRLQIAD